MNKFGLPEDVFADILKVLRRYPEIKHAKIFGSRAKGNYTRYSDVDIAIFADINTGYRLVQDIQHDLDELDVIYTFDVLHYDSTSNAEIRAHVDRVGVDIIPKKGLI